jgi:predicted DNA-binding ribbon-helix-helix protein
MTSTKTQYSPASPARRAQTELSELAAGLVCRGITIGRRRTSIRLDNPTWRALQEIALRADVSISQLCTLVARNKPGKLSLTVAIRSYVVRYFHDAATDKGHVKAGHGTLQPICNRHAGGRGISGNQRKEMVVSEKREPGR